MHYVGRSKTAEPANANIVEDVGSQVGFSATSLGATENVALDHPEYGRLRQQIMRDTGELLESVGNFIPDDLMSPGRRDRWLEGKREAKALREKVLGQSAALGRPTEE